MGVRCSRCPRRFGLERPRRSRTRGLMQTLPNRRMLMDRAVAESIVQPRPDFQNAIHHALVPSFGIGVTARPHRAQCSSAAQVGDGWTYTTNITIDSGKADARISIAMRNRITATAVRMDFLQVSGSAAGNAAKACTRSSIRPTVR